MPLAKSQIDQHTHDLKNSPRETTARPTAMDRNMIADLMNTVAEMLR
jgi:hypothetical protein